MGLAQEPQRESLEAESTRTAKPSALARRPLGGFGETHRRWSEGHAWHDDADRTPRSGPSYPNSIGGPEDRAMSHRQEKKARQSTRRQQAAVQKREEYLASLSYRRKLARAEVHIEEFQAAVVAWSSDGYRVTEETESNGGTKLYAQLVEPIPDNLSLITGDAFQCLRNSLDHIVFSLSQKGTPNMTADDEDKPMFPITRGTKPIVDSNSGIQFLTGPARKAVLDLTPDPTGQQVNNEPLFLLNKMSNRDKHREIPLLAVSHSVGWAFSSGYAEYFRAYDGDVLEVGAEPVLLAEYRVVGLGHSPAKHKVSPTPVVQFGPGVEVAGQQVVPTLRLMHDHIRDTVFKCLERHL